MGLAPSLLNSIPVVVAPVVVRGDVLAGDRITALEPAAEVDLRATLRAKRAMLVDNSYVTIVWKSGVVGLVLFLTLYGIALRRAIRLARHPHPEARMVGLGTAGAIAGMLLLAMARGAELLILDEPMEGLDPAANDDVLRELVDLSANEGTTIFFSSHQIADVEQITDHVCIINHGTSLVSGSLDDIKARCRKIQIIFPDGPPPSIQWVDGARQIRQEGRVVSMLATENLDAILAQGRSIPGAQVEIIPLTLKEIFLGYIRN